MNCGATLLLAPLPGFEVSKTMDYWITPKV